MKFLQQIAKIYAEILTPTSQFLFVFPNRRAGLFFRKELLSLVKKPIFAPDITDINSLAALISPLQKANDIELLFALYESYVHVRSQHTDEIESIDAFIPFGTTLLGDFNEIDKYLVDTKLLFSNIADLKNINDQSQFLSDEQIAALKSFWGNVQNERNENLSFNRQFISLWDDLHDIYTHFTQSLITRGIGYDGLIYRTAIKKLSTFNFQLSTFKSIVFIGFNSLTTSEYRIFKHFQQQGIADFYFDYPACYSAPSPFASTVGKYYERNLREFPSRYPYTQPTESHIPNITLHSTPSATNQINVACSLLTNNNQQPATDEIQNLNPNGDCRPLTVDSRQQNSTAILLADESLMPSLIQQLPANIERINITMGYPLSITPIATLINHILTLQTELTNNREGIAQFYYKPILSILSHSNIQSIYPTSSAKIIDQITRANYIRITAEKLHEIINNLNTTDEERQFFITLFTPHTTASDLLEYLINIIHKLSTINSQLSTEKEFLYQYNQQLNQLKTLLATNSQLSTLHSQLLKMLIMRLTSSLKVQFKGEPIEGMQIMGLLESRLLDFENIILIGFNDQKVPGNKSVNSIIPYNLRRAYNLPTHEVSDAIQAYNFYRTLYHTQNLHLIYDSRNEGAQNEISRYFYQLQYLLRAPMQQYNYQLQIHDPNNETSDNQEITIHKTPEILNKLNSYKNQQSTINGQQILNPDGDYRLSTVDCRQDKPSLSASRLKDYIACPLRFYFSTITGIKSPNEIKETGESSLLGRIYHKAMELYYNQHSEPQNLNKQQIETLVHDAFTEESISSGKQVQITGFNSLIFNLVYQFIKNTIRFDIARHEQDQFSNVQSEVEINHIINNIRFKGYIDRIDQTADTINIIDYKTTTSKTKANINILDLFTSYESAYHELFQIILYCHIYNSSFLTPHSSFKIRPLLYKTYELSKSDTKLHNITLIVPNELLDPTNLPPLDTPLDAINTDKANCTSIEITDYSLIATPFEWLLTRMLNNIYNPDLPFAPTELSTEEKACGNFCPYKTICKKIKSKQW